MLMIAAALAAAQTAPQDAGADPACEGSAHVFRAEQKPARQGATIRLYAAVYRRDAPSEEDPRCMTDWRVSDPQVATLSADHKSVTIAADAPPGTKVSIGYTVRGERKEVELTVLARDAVSLVGNRGQIGIEGCSGDSIGELVFDADGGFSVTFHPFESYHDYWGTYAFDAATGALTLEVTRGNSMPAFRTASGTARFDAEGRLHIEGLSFGNVQPVPDADGHPHWPAKCHYIFG